MKIFRPKSLLAVAVLSTALVFIGAGAAVAAATFKSGTTVTRVVISTENAATLHSSTSFVTVRTIGIFAQANSHVLARFTAESACSGGSGWCSARILIDGFEAEPAAGLDFAFNSTDANRETSLSWESLSMERARTVTFTGTHTITLQLAKVGTGVVHRIDDWTLTGWAIAL